MIILSILILLSLFCNAYLSFRLWKIEQDFKKDRDELFKTFMKFQEDLTTTGQLTVDLANWREDITTKAQERAKEATMGRGIRRG